MNLSIFPIRQFALTVYLATFLGALATSTLLPAAAQEKERPDPERWADDIRHMEVRAQQDGPRRGGIVFIGSSSIRLWDLAASFPDQPAINFGFGGSHLADSVHFFHRLVVPYQPRIVVVYAGDNDIHYGLTAHQVRDDFERLAERMQQELPEAHLIYISIKPSLARWSEFDRMQQANRQIDDICRTNDHLHFVDVGPAMLASDGQPNEKLFRDDGLHLNAEGYRVWTHLLDSQLIRLDGQPSE